MFYYLSGELAYLEKNLAVIECGGVGYGAIVSDKTCDALRGKIGQSVKLFTFLNVREDAAELFGFISLEEKNAFRQLISISGVGPKMAVTVLSELTPSEFASAIIMGNSAAFTRVSGVGAKKASRIVLELRDKIANQQIDDVRAVSGGAVAPAGSEAGEAVNALCVLGYSRVEAANAVKSAAVPEDASVEEIIRLSLKYLM